MPDFVGSNEGGHNMLTLRNKKKVSCSYPLTPIRSSALLKAYAVEFHQNCFMVILICFHEIRKNIQ